MAEIVVTGDEVECSGDDAELQARTTSGLQAKFYITCLPNELLLHIFSFLSVPELCFSVAPVCTAWRDLAKDPILWRHLEFNFVYNTDTKREQRLVTASPFLLSLELQNLTNGNFLLHVADSCKMLRKLTLIHCIDPSYTCVLQLSERNRPVIQRLITDRHSRLTYSFLLTSGFKELRYLNFNMCSSLTDEELESIARQCKHLQYLNIEDMSEIHDSSITLLTKELGHCLKSLHIHGKYLTDISYKSFSNLVLLEELMIMKCVNMTDVGLRGLHGLKKLTSLTLFLDDGVSVTGLTDLFTGKRLSQLVHLELVFQSLNDLVVKTLARNCPNLLRLTLKCMTATYGMFNPPLLTSSTMTDAGIAEVVARCPLLQELNLTRMPNLTGTALINIPTALPHLSGLELWGCSRVNSTIIQRLEDQIPSLIVFSPKELGWVRSFR
nr:F-box/LRR-repeat protein 14-like [Cherax quadricarinatus]